jgi:hypothetical protein
MSEDEPGGHALQGEPERAISQDEARASAETADPGVLSRIVQAAPITKRHTNIDQTAIEVTEDRARLVLGETVELIRRGREWMGPAGLFLGLLTGVITGDFHEELGLTPDTIKGMAIFATAASGIWTLVKVADAVRLPSSKTLVDHTIEQLKHREPD